jgi:putative hydrolase of the HAD superfamily
MVSISQKANNSRSLYLLTLFSEIQFRAVIFDLDSTLMDTQSYPLVASQWLLKRANVASDELTSKYLKILVMRYYRAIEDIVNGAPFRTPFEIVRTAMGNSLRDIGQEVDSLIVEEATQRFKALHLELSKPYPGVLEMLSTLKLRGLKIGVVSNSFEGHTLSLLEKLHLREYFQAIVDCGAVKAYKPMRQIFNETLRRLGVSSSDAIFVGDEYYADMVGAKNVNLTTAWINSRNRSIEDMIEKYGPESSPDYVMHSITEFAKML